MTLKPNKASKGVDNKKSNSNRNGWTVGGGLEYALTDNFSVRGEYLYVNIPKTKEKKISSMDFSVIRAGLNYKF
jgi:outer membrane immunogenic protein